MRVRRLRLLETEIVEHEAGSYEAIVKLRFQDKNFIGTEEFSKGEEEERLEAVARATIGAIRQALPLPVDIYLRKVLRLNPQFLNELLLVAMVDFYIDCRRLSLTGCCVCERKDIAFGIARATLDSTNRVVDHLLKNIRPGPNARR